MKTLLASLFMFLLPLNAFAGVIAYDDLTVEGKPVKLRAETKGKYFKQGGRVVEFQVNGKPLGKALSGGDAMAYLEFKPAKKSLYKIIAASAGQKSEALLLCLKKGDGIVFIDVTGGLLINPVSKKPRTDAQKAVKEIMGFSAVVYIHSEIFGITMAKDWLRENEFPDAPLLAWGEGAVFDDAVSLDLKIIAVIGSPAVIESAKKYKPMAFSFEENEGATYVGQWNEVLKEVMGRKVKLKNIKSRISEFP